MNDYRFILDKTSKKFYCPDCNKKTFVRYIDTRKDEYLQEKYGRCDREIKCSYHLSPYYDGFANLIWEQEKGAFIKNKKAQLTPFKALAKQEIKEPVFIPYEILKATRKGYEQNVFIQNLLHNIPFTFTAKEIEQIISLYQLGTVCKGYRKGAITFPFIDIKGNVRAVQAKQFDKMNHTTSTDFLHSMYKKDCEKNNKPLPEWLSNYLLNDKKISCLFGEHLLSKCPTNPIALVEAPKTAIIASLYFGFPDNPKNFIWLGVYNLSSLNIAKCKVLQGRKVFLFPDLNAFDNWSKKANNFQKEMPDTTFKVSYLLQNHASKEEKENGFDIADFLIHLNWRDFR